MDAAVGESSTTRSAQTQPGAGSAGFRVVHEIDEDPGKGAIAQPGKAAQPRSAPGPATENWCWRVLCANWCTRWVMDEELRAMMPPRHSDFRDSLPLPLEDVYQAYRPYVQNGKWTMGLLRMWFPEQKPVKHSVHIPCWDSFRILPWHWRGFCFGRNFDECIITGLRQSRWARGVYAANLGREYVLPIKDIGRHGYISDIKALFGMYFSMGCIFGCGIGQAFSLCGNIGANFAACYSCHARERMRRKWNLPPAFGLPPGIDDCLVHFFCSYCASHQEMRELAVRGVDGPGLHILDVSPNSFKHNEGFEAVRDARKALVDGMLTHPPRWFRAREKKAVKEARAKAKAEAAAAAAAAAAGGVPAQETEGGPSRASLATAPSAASVSSTGESTLGWVRYGSLATPPTQQAMDRGGGEEMAADPAARVKRHWSVSY